MAEFTEVMRQVKRMCDATVSARCHECTLWRPETESCSLYGDDDGVDYADMERRVMAWAAEHAEPRYPTWREWQRSMFPGAGNNLYPCSFLSHTECKCNGWSTCDECRGCPIPADIAAKLGIRPITTAKAVPAHDGCAGCRWTDKHAYEEPCKNCCCVMGIGGSAPDLCEEG